MSTRAIRTSADQATCDVCGRTLLRGERAEVYLSGGSRRSVCELCTTRALHDGWVREGEVPEYDESSRRPDRRRSLLGRLRGRRDRPEAPEAPARGFDFGPNPFDEPLDDGPGFGEEALPPPPVAHPAPAPAPSRADAARRAAARLAAGRQLSGREPRHVRAVPTSIEHRISSAISLFNDSEHPRTVAGIARSLGLPDVSVHPADAAASLVNIVVSWELCWYRYEVELADEVPGVRVGGQGYELDELSEIERQNNALADERGRLTLGG